MADGMLVLGSAVIGMAATGIPALWAVFRALEQAKAATKRLDNIEKQDGTIGRLHARIDDIEKAQGQLHLVLVEKQVLRAMQIPKRRATGAVSARVEDSGSEDGT